MKTCKRILAMLMAVLLLCSAMSAFAEVEVELDAPQELEVPQDIEGLDPDIDVPNLDLSLDALELSDDLALEEEEPEAPAIVSNADGEASTPIYQSFTLEVGQQKRLHEHPRKIYSHIVTDASSDPNVARVSGSGIVTAVTAGKCVITVTAVRRWGDGQPRVWKYDVTVVGGPVLSETEKTLNISETFQLNVSNLGKRSVRSWSSSDPNVATVDDGKVTAVGVGQCDISVEISNGGFLRCRVTVQNEGAVGLSSNAVRLKLRKFTTVWLSDRLLRNITWSCSNPKIVTIMAKGSTCLIIARKKGECTVTATLKGGQSYSCRVIVE